MQGDTVAALADLDKAIEVDRHRAQAYSQRGVLTAVYRHDYDAALADLDRAVRLEPNTPSHYINRALIRYYREDLRGAMDDYDKVISLEPTNLIARYNRGLLLLSVGAKNDALADFNYYLQREPDNLMARYNRAILLSDLGEYRAAVGDFDAVLEAYPEFYQGLYARSEAKRLSGDTAGGKKDYQQAMALYEASKKAGATPSGDDKDDTGADAGKVRKESDRNINKFDRLLVADNTAGVEQEYTSEIRGRIQDRAQRVEISPQFTLTYYEKTEGVRRGLHMYPSWPSSTAPGSLPSDCSSLMSRSLSTRCRRHRILPRCRTIRDSSISIPPIPCPISDGPSTLCSCRISTMPCPTSTRW